LAKQLEEDGITTAAIHGNKSQNARTQALAGFKQGSVRALVATEVAARGLDIKELPFVVNYELPNVPEDYVHRIGRTGRAGASGIAVSLVASDEMSLLKDIERTIGKSIPREPLPEISVAPRRPASSVTAQQQGQAQAPRRPQSQSQGQGARRPASRAHHGGRGPSQGSSSGNSNGNSAGRRPW
jgi:ATP-dependent RNA helicase RhlE